MINLSDLEIFVDVVTNRSMSVTGRSLGLSPALISKRIKRLEDQLGTRLLQRTTRQLSLTEVGQGFYDRALAILAGLEDAESYIAGRSADMHGVLKISAPTSFGRMHVAPHLRAFMERHPNLAINLVLTDELTDIIGGGFDLAIRIAELIDSSLVARRLTSIRRVLCASPDYIKRHGLPDDIDDLRRHICLPAHNNDAWRLTGPNGPLTIRPQGMLMTNSSEVIREAVIAGLGIALRSTWDIGSELRNGQLVQVLPTFEGSQNVALSAVYPSRQYLPSKVRLFIDFLAEIYSPIPYWDVQSNALSPDWHKS